MKARATLLGHPIHQMLIPLPLGLLVGVVLFDVLYLVTGGDAWPIVAYWLIPAGVLTGLLAAAFGLLDWTRIPAGTRAKRVGLLHAFSNIIMLVLFAASWLVRGTPDAGPGTLAIVLSLSAGAVSLVAGWLGGELVDRLSIGVEDGAHPDAPSSLSRRPVRERA